MDNIKKTILKIEKLEENDFTSGEFLLLLEKEMIKNSKEAYTKKNLKKIALYQKE
jgi:hypothetical protein